MQSVGYIPNTFEDKMIHLDERVQMEQEALKRLTPRELEIINLRYFENMTRSEVAQFLGMSEEYVRQVENKALIKLRHIILKPKTDIVDSKTGMTESDWWYLAGSIASWLECQSTNNARLAKRRGLLTQWAKDIIMWRLTSDERQILLWYHQIMPYPGRYNQEFYETVQDIHKWILEMLLEDELVTEKTNYKVRV